MIKWTWYCSTLAVVLCIYKACATDVSGPVIGFSCVTYNWIEYVVCKWNYSLGTNLQNVDILWRPVIINSRWYICSEPTKTSCKWNIEDGRLAIDIERTYTILIRVNKNQLQQSVFHIRWNETVQPAPVNNIHVTYVGISCVTLNWEHSDYIHNKTFKISYKPTNSDEEKVKTIYSDHDTVHLPICNLLIYTKYMVTVTCKTVKKGIWSKPVSTTFLTNKSHPLSPYVFEGGYAWRATAAKNVKITFFWKLLTKLEWNADTIHYHVQLNNEMKQLSKRTNQFALTFEVRRNSNYLVNIWARNEIGDSEQQSIKVTPYRELDLLSEVFVVKNQTNGVQLSWTNPPDKNIKLYSIFWCEHAFADICAKAPSSIKIQSLTKPPFIIVDAHEKKSSYLFGVSYTTTENITSGFIWSDCSVDLTSSEFPYDLMINLRASNDMVVVKWQLAKCNFLLRKLDIQMFTLKVCNDASCKDYRAQNITGTEDKTSIPKTNRKVCVQVLIYWNEKYRRQSKTECIKVDISSDEHLKMIIGISSIFVIVAGFGFFLVLRKIAKKIKKAKKPYTIELPVLQNNVNPIPAVDHGLPLLETG